MAFSRDLLSAPLSNQIIIIFISSIFQVFNFDLLVKQNMCFDVFPFNDFLSISFVEVCFPLFAFETFDKS